MMGGRYNYNYNYNNAYNYQQPYYANHSGGWPAMRPVLPPPPPPPYVEHQNAKKVKNDVNVHKDTLKLEVDELNPDQHLVSFVFDALYDGRSAISMLSIFSYFGSFGLGFFMSLCEL